jgi:tRNA (cytosine40_48-C5)-methyltransferase
MNTPLFLKRYAALGETFEPASIQVQPSLRVNTLKTDAEHLRRRLEARQATLIPIPHLTEGFFYEAPFSLGATTEYLLGHYYLQDAASQLPALALDPRPGDQVFDMAASPGGKTTQMAALMKNTGTIIALDVNTQRLASLKNNCERLGVQNVVMYKKDARFAPDLKMQFDRILLDAPCSGNFCIEPRFFEEKTLQGVTERSKLQKELFKAAVRVLKPGGRLVYSTCSLEPEEDELIVAWALAKYPDLEIIDSGIRIGDPGITHIFDKILPDDVRRARRFWPHKTGTEGFFIATFIKHQGAKTSA